MPRLDPRWARAEPDELADLDAEPRPKTRQDCLAGGMNEARPCPWVSCRNHIALELSASGSLYTADGWDEDGRPSCVADMVEAKGPCTLEEIGNSLNLTRERVRQIEQQGIRKIIARMCLSCGHVGPLAVRYERNPARASLDRTVVARCPSCGSLQRDQA